MIEIFFLTVLHVSHIKACYVQPVVRATLCKTVMQQWIMPSNVVRKHENWPTFLMHSHLCEFDFGIPNRWRELSHAVTYLLHCDSSKLEGSCWCVRALSIQGWTILDMAVKTGLQLIASVLQSVDILLYSKDFSIYLVTLIDNKCI